MGLFSIFKGIAKVVGGVVKTAGSIASGDVKGAIKGIAGAVGGVSSLAGGGGSSQQYIQPPKTSLADLKASRNSSTALSTKTVDTKVAKTTELPNLPGSSLLMDDPWKPTRDWWTDLGGDPERIKKVNKEDLPF